MAVSSNTGKLWNIIRFNSPFFLTTSLCFLLIKQEMMFSAHQEDFLRRIAIRSGMQGKQFQEMLAVDGPDHVIQELSTLADEKGIEIPNIDSLYSSMTINSDIAQKAFKKWYPGEVFFSALLF